MKTSLQHLPHGLTTRWFVSVVAAHYAGLALAALALVSSALSAAEEPTYKKTASLPPIRVTYAELQGVIDKTASLLTIASGSDAAPVAYKLQIKRGESQVDIDGRKLVGSTAKLPKLATELTYSARVQWNPFRGDTQPAVTSVEMTFYDFDRRITVEGRSPDQVDAVFAALKTELAGLSSPYGGRMFRELAGMLVVVFSGLVLGYGLPYWWTHRQRRLVLPLLLAALATTLVFLLPFNELLAGFSVSEFDPSFAARYAPELSVLGIILAIAGIPLSYLLPIWLQSGPTNRTEPTTKRTPGELTKPVRRVKKP
jgi:hypothetical protein